MLSVILDQWAHTCTVPDYKRADTKHRSEKMQPFCVYRPHFPAAKCHSDDAQIAFMATLCY